MARIQLSGTQIPTLSKLNVDGEFTLDAASGTTGQILMSQGTGNTPAWTSSLTALTGLSSAATVALPISTGGGSGAVGILSLTGGNTSSTTQNGGAISITGGNATNTTVINTGGSVTIKAGNGNSNQGAGGSVSIDGGTGSVANGNGSVSIGTGAGSDSVVIGKSGGQTTIDGTLTAVPTFPSTAKQLFLASPTGATGTPTFRYISTSDFTQSSTPTIGQALVAAPVTGGWSWLTPMSMSGGTQTFAAAPTITTVDSTTGNTPAITLTTGATSFNGGTTGAITISTGAPTGTTSSSSGNLTLSTPNASGSSGGAGGNISITAGNGSGSGGVGGSVSINAGAAVSTGTVNIGNTTGFVAISRSGSSISLNGTVNSLYLNQPAVTALSTAGANTLTIAQMLTLIITVTQTAAVTLTLPTGTLTDAGIQGGASAIRNSFDWSVINLGTTSGAVTMAAGTAHTYVGNATVAIGTSAGFRTVKTAANTYITYRIR